MNGKINEEMINISNKSILDKELAEIVKNDDVEKVEIVDMAVDLADKDQLTVEDIAGKYVVQCDECKQLICPTKEQLTINTSGNITGNFICPSCNNETAYTLIGKIDENINVPNKDIHSNNLITDDIFADLFKDELEIEFTKNKDSEDIKISKDFVNEELDKSKDFSEKNLYDILVDISSIEELPKFFLITYDDLLNDNQLHQIVKYTLNRIGNSKDSIVDVYELEKDGLNVDLFKERLFKIIINIYDTATYNILLDVLFEFFDTEEDMYTYLDKSINEDVNSTGPVDKEIKLEDAKTLNDVIKFLVADEVSAIDGYSNAIAKINELDIDEKVRAQYTDLFEHLISEEEHHINELEAGKELADYNNA